jgi:hypothetical protein
MRRVGWSFVWSAGLAGFGVVFVFVVFVVFIALTGRAG